MSGKKSELLQRTEYAAYRAVARLVRNASDQSIARWGTRFGAAASKVLRGRDRLAMNNLRAAFPDKDERELRSILDETWRHFGREMLEYVRMQSMPLEEIAARCPFQGEELIKEGLARGKGVILISAHWGGWEVAGLAITALWSNVRTVARVLDNEYLERDLARIRSKTGVEVIDRRKAARPLMKGLADNAIVVMVPDQAVQPREGVLVPFLGRPAWTTDAPAKLALRHGSTIVFAFCIPLDFRHRLEFEEAIRVDQLPPEEQDPTALTTRINEVISRRIAARPDLWLWMHDRWKWTGESEVRNG